MEEENTEEIHRDMMYTIMYNITVTILKDRTDFFPT